MANNSTAKQVKDGLKQAVERELIRGLSRMPSPGPPKFSQVTHIQDAARASIEDLPVSDDLERKIQDFAQRLANAKGDTILPTRSN